MNELPKSLDETYERVLKGIHETNRSHVHRLLQCLAVSIRPLYVVELAEILTSDPDVIEGEVLKFDEDSRSEDQEQELLSACPSLITIVDSNNARVVQFSHFSVKEFLTSDRLATSSEDISGYHIHPDAAHTTLTQASLAVLLRLDDRVDSSNAWRIPLAEYAAGYWVSHAQVGSVSSRVMRTIKTLFDSDKPHFAAWVRIYDIDGPPYWYYSRRNTSKPLYYSALCGFHDLVQHLVKKDSHHVNAIGGTRDYPLVAALHGGHIRIAELLIQHGANVDIQGTEEQTPLHRAIEWPNNLAVGAVQFLFKHGADVNARREDLSTSLHLAAAQGYFEVAQMLLERRVDVNSRNVGGKTPLHLVAKLTFPRSESNRLNLVELLLEYGAEVNSRDKKGATVLHDASLLRDLEVARVLLDHGAYVNAEDNWRRTPLHRVLEPVYYLDEGRFDVARLLVERGADVNIPDKNHETPLHLASFHLDLELVQLLLDHGANVNAENNRGQTSLDRVFEFKCYSDQDDSGVAQLLMERGADVNARDKDHETLLHLASSRQDLELVAELLFHGANPDAKDNKGKSPLHRAVEPKYYFDEGRFGVAQLLVERGADVNTRHKGYKTLVRLASSRLNLKSVRVPRDHGTNVDAEDNRGQTPLDRVFEDRYNSEEETAARLLLGFGADVDARDKDHETPLHLASHCLYPKSVRVLLDRDADVNAENNRGQTPLHLAIKSMSYSDELDFGVAQLLVERGADVNARDKRHETPLHLASRLVSLEGAWILLKHGADLNAENYECKIPFQLSRESIREETKNLPSEYSFRWRARRAQCIALMGLLYGY